MGKKDKRIDTYIAKSGAFAQPVLNHLREQVHRACPGVDETIKWGFPHFMFHGILCSMAAFKEHCAFGFWKAALMKDTGTSFSAQGETGMGQLGRIRSIKDLPANKTLYHQVREAMKLNEEGAKRIPSKTKPGIKKPLKTPAYLLHSLNKNKKAKETFERFSPSHRREYVEWITEAKTEVTRGKRIATMLEWLAEGKGRNWKYQQKKSRENE